MSTDATVDTTTLPRWSQTTFPHPPGRKPFIGDLDKRREYRPIQAVMRRTAGMGPVCEFKALRTRFVLVTDAGVAAELCDERRFEKTLPPGLVALRNVAGDGLFTARNEEPNWRLAHDLLLPAFSRPAMQSYHATMLRTTGELLDRWDSAAAQGREVEVSGDLTRLALETIARCAFSYDFGSFTREEQHPFVTAMVITLQGGQRRGAFANVPVLGRLVGRSIDRREAEHLAYQRGLLDEIIEARRASGEIDDRDLLGIMLGQTHPETGERLSDENVRHQILTFLVAGHETTSGTLSFALHYLARDPTILALARAEVDQILGGDRDTEPTFEQVAKFRYVRRVIDETLRLWPTAPGFSRGPREPTVVAGRWLMEPGDMALVLLPVVHRDPKVWGPDPEKFDPDRFTSAQVHARLPHSYKPFGTGERACIGRQFALHEAVIALARILHRYDLADDPAYELVVGERLTLMPQDFTLRLARRA